MSTPLAAWRFDGTRAEAVPVTVSVADGELIVARLDGTLLEREPIARARVSEAFRHAPRLIVLSSGATLEVPDAGGALTAALEQAGLRPSPIVRLRRWPAAVALAVVMLVSLLVAGYLKGVPVAARWVAFAMAPALEQRMGDQLLSVLDQYLRRSALPSDRREALAARFARGAAAVAPGVAYRLEFRTAGDGVINALTLPGGLIILFDGLVKFAIREDAVLAVLAHELGHVVHKHPTRHVLQSVGVGATAGLLWGDFAGSAASAPVAVGLLRYSRDFEREADDFAIAFVRSQGLSTEDVYTFFVRMRDRDPSRGGHVPEFLSTHPSTEERIERFRRELERR